MNQWHFRGAQLDLARQMESIQFIRNFIDFIAENKYNTLFLYLEDRIRTKSYPYPAPNEAYTPDEMRGIVDYAAARGIEVVPCVSVLGHAERFLRHPELEYISELQGETEGRFHTKEKYVFCPSNEALYDFLGKYLAEVAELFPSKYFHIGLDEAWDIGFCKTCSKKAETYMGEQRLMLDNLLRCHAILRKLGKRVMMWDDMFECYRDIITEVPRDVIMVNWQYQNDAGRSLAHFVDLVIEDLPALYEKLGFEYIIAPADYTTSNIRTFTEHGRRGKPLGGLLTTWGKCVHFLYRSFPAIAFAGRLWNGDDEKTAWDGMLASIFGTTDRMLSALMHTAYPLVHKEISVSEGSLLTKPFFGLEYDDMAKVRLMNATLEAVLPKVTPELGRTVLEDMNLALKSVEQGFRLRELLHKAVDTAWDSKIESEYVSLLAEYEKARPVRKKFWEKHREGITPCSVDSHYEEILGRFREQMEKFRNEAMLTVRFCLVNQYSAPRCRISFLINGEYKQVASGVFKANDVSRDSIYERTFHVPKYKPETIRFEVDGFGGQGIAYAEYKDGSTVFVPKSVKNTDGRVSDPEYAVNNDGKYAFLGTQDMYTAFSDRKQSTLVNTLELNMEKR